MNTTTTDIRVSTKLRAHADCPYCEFSGEIAVAEGWYDNQWDLGRGGFRVTCPSCDKPYTIIKDTVAALQRDAQVLLGEVIPPSAFYVAEANTKEVVVVCRLCRGRSRYPWSSTDRDDYATVEAFAEYCVANANDEHVCENYHERGR